MQTKIVFIISLLIACSGLFSQSNLNTFNWRQSERDSMNKAQILYDEENYVTALPIFEGLLKNHPKELFLKYMNGLCGLYRSDKHAESLTFLTEVFSKNKQTLEIELDLAKAHHLNSNFNEALRFIEAYKVRMKDKLPPKVAKEMELLTHYCNNANKLVQTPIAVTITNIGDTINTEASEYVPVISSNESVLIYTYKGKNSTGGLENKENHPDPSGTYCEDVFISYKDSTNNFEAPKSIGININSISNDAAVALSPDGQSLYIYKDDVGSGDLYLSTLVGKEWSIPERLSDNVNSSSWEGSCSISADGKKLYFSSERNGGSGGKDLYYSILQDDGLWGTAINLGQKINSPYDEDAPFIHPDGRTLLFSSRGKNSMGGYDIFKTVYNPADSSWTEPENLGYPINTPDDEIYYVLTADGKTGYYSSGKSGGRGFQDIYKVSPGLIGLSPALALVSGKITLNGIPAEATIRVESETTPAHPAGGKQKYADIVSNSATGKYLVNLPAGQVYKITCHLRWQKDQVKKVDLSTTTVYTEKTININFSSFNADTSQTIGPANKPSVSASPSALLVLKEPEAAVELPQKTGNEQVAGLFYKIQIAAFKLPDNYNFDKLQGLGNVDKQELDGIMRFTIGGDFQTLNSANDHCKKVRYAGQKDAFIIAIYNGKRAYLEDLEKEGIIPHVRH